MKDALYAAVKQNNRDELAALLRNRDEFITIAKRLNPTTIVSAEYSLNTVYDDGETLLTHAARHQYSAIIKLLTTWQTNYDEPTLNLNVNNKNKKGVTALMLSAMNNDTNNLNSLLIVGADPTLQDDTGYTALSYATYGGQLASTQALLNSKLIPNINQQSKTQSTALHYAVENRYANKMDSLTAESTALPIVEALLCAQPNLELTNQAGFNVLLRAAYLELPNVIVALIRAGANIHTTLKDKLNSNSSYKGKSAFELAAHNPRILCVLHSADLLDAIKADNKVKFRHLITEQRQYCDIHFKDNDGNSVYILAKKHTDKFYLNILEERFLIIDETDEKQKNHSLLLAARHSMSDTVNYYLAQGASIDAQDDSGTLAAAIAEHGDLQKIWPAQSLPAATANDDRDTKDFKADVKQSAIAMTTTASRPLPNFKQVNQQQETLLIIAAKHGRILNAQYLLQRGVDVNARDEKGNSALSYAVTRGAVELVKIICEKKPNTETLNNNQNGSLFAATLNSLASEDEAIHIFTALHNAGLKALKLEDIQIAIEKKYTELLKWMLEKFPAQQQLIVNAVGKNNRTVIYLAVEVQDLALVTAICKAQPNETTLLTIPDGEKDLIVTKAMRTNNQGTPKILDQLVAAGAYVTQDALRLALNTSATVTSLLTATPDKIIVADRGLFNIALFNILKYFSDPAIDFYKKMIAYADVNFKMSHSTPSGDYLYESYFHVAARWGKFDIINLLAAQQPTADTLHEDYYQYEESSALQIGIARACSDAAALAVVTALIQAGVCKGRGDAKTLALKKGFKQTAEYLQTRINLGKTAKNSKPIVTTAAAPMASTQLVVLANAKDQKHSALDDKQEFTGFDQIKMQQAEIALQLKIITRNAKLLAQFLVKIIQHGTQQNIIDFITRIDSIPVHPARLVADSEGMIALHHLLRTNNPLIKDKAVIAEQLLKTFAHEQLHHKGTTGKKPVDYCEGHKLRADLIAKAKTAVPQSKTNSGGSGPVSAGTPSSGGDYKEQPAAVWYVPPVNIVTTDKYAVVLPAVTAHPAKLFDLSPPAIPVPPNSPAAVASTITMKLQPSG